MSWVIPALVFFGLWIFLMRRFADMQGACSLMSIGKSKARVYIQTDTGATFADVAGVDEARQELEDVVDFLRHPQAHGRPGAHMPKGVLLVGPPGTSKTLLAKSVASGANVSFFSILASEFVELSTGAADDLAKASDIARDMVSRYGMGGGLGHAALEAQRSTLPDLPAAFGQSDPPLSEDTRHRDPRADHGSEDGLTRVLGSVDRDRPLKAHLTQILLLLLMAMAMAMAMAVVLACQRLQVPTSLGYLLVGVILGLHTVGPPIPVPEFEALAGFGVVFLLFTIGLNFSLPQLHALRHQALGLDTGQVALTMAAVGVAAWLAGVPGAAAFAQSSTTIIASLLKERGEDSAPHGVTVVSRPVACTPCASGLLVRATAT